ncbi:MAG: bifunctional transaldolase/phosoglucose isomerase [Caulobacteraceae bacterium]|nr:bifunctional transaldolase/phosoglucose isomerase [Caulobacteraceae bacterium]
MTPDPANPLLALAEAGQAVWLDYLHRKILEDGELQRLITEDGLKGMTSNPSIFDKAIGEGDAYDAALNALIARRDAQPGDLYEALAIADIQAAADIFRPTWERLGGTDGYVSLEVSPYLGMDTEATVAEARRLWRAVGRPNLMIKVPGTKPGVPAIRTLIGEGINVNVTLLFGLEAYLAVADAHMAGLEAHKARGGDLAKVHGVASFFVSRIDGLIDKAIDERLKSAPGNEAEALKALRGKVAIANAKIAYQRYLEMIASPRWQALAAAGALPQRLLWASTGTKDPAYSDVLYVETLIGPNTVNTMPPKTMDAFRDHGLAGASLTQDVEGARRTLDEAERLGLDLDGVTDALVVDGMAKFAEAFDALLGAVAGKRAQILGTSLDAQSMKLPADLDAAVKAALERAAHEGWTRRLWAKDASLWTGGDEAKWLGWLAAGTGGAVDLAALDGLRGEVKSAGYRHALLLGMGGSSLGPEVLAKTFGPEPGFPELLVLDSTDPAQIARVEAMIDPAATLFIVSSKSGSTLEPDILHRYFFAAAEKALGAGKAGGRFIAVTDPGSKLEATARRDGFAHVFPGDPAIGGRYSVLSNFGMVPAAVLGLDPRALFDAAAPMVLACQESAPPAANPGFVLGAALGAAAKAGRDKVTLMASPAIADIGAWLEQLLAESTGKQGKGLIPVAGEPIGAPEAYGGGRLFAYLRLEGDDNDALDEAARALEEAGGPVVRITLADRLKLTQEFFRWEIAVAVAGAVIGIDPFDQPDVEASKVKARALTDAYEKTGRADAEAPVFEAEGLAVFADLANAEALGRSAGVQSVEAWLGAHFARAGKGDYIGLLAWLDREAGHVEALGALRRRLRDHGKIATVVGFGPRFLHSTGQAYKGGPNSGVFLQITAKPAADIAVPGRSISFGVVEAAQARGDFEVLAERGRRLLRIDLGEDVEEGLVRLARAVDRALG